MQRFATILGVLVLATLLTPREAPAQGAPAHRTRTVATFDIVNDVPGVPEGITTDGDGGLYVSLFLLDEIWQVNPATGEKKKVADVPGGGLKGDLIGLERDPADGTILAAFKRATKVDLFTAEHPDCRDPTDAATGVYRVNPQTGAVTPFVTRGMGIALCFPDDMAVDQHGSVYVSDIELGLIWKFNRAGRGGVWSDDPLLGWTEQSGTWNSSGGQPVGYLGVNDIALSPDGLPLRRHRWRPRRFYRKRAAGSHPRPTGRLGWESGPLRRRSRLQRRCGGRPRRDHLFRGHLQQRHLGLLAGRQAASIGRLARAIR